MIQSSNRGGASSLSRMLSTLGRASRQRTTEGFARQLATAGETSAAGSTEAPASRLTRQDSVSRAAARQNIDTASRAVAPAPANTRNSETRDGQAAGVNNETPVPPQSGAVQPAATSTRAMSVETDPVSVLTNALTAAGLSASGVKFTRSDEMVGYPGGSYRNHVITAEFSDGRRESFGVDLMMRNPRVTVVELGRMMGFTVSGEQLSRIQTPVQS